MADFNLQVEVTAKADEFDRAIQKMERDMEEVAAEIEQSGASMGKSVADGAEAATHGLEGMLLVAGKVMAAMAAFELSVGLAGAAINLFSGNWEGMRQNLSSLPIIGGLITKFYEAGDAASAASYQVKEYEAAMARLDETLTKVGQSMTVLNEEVARQERLLQLRGRNEADIAELTYDKKKELLDLEHKERLALLEKEKQERIDALVKEYGQESEIGDALMKQVLDEIKERERQERFAHGQRLEILDLELKAAQRAVEEERLAREAADAEAAAAQEKADQEAHRLRMEQEAEYLAAQMQGAEDAKRARLAALAEEEAARQKAAEEALAFEMRRQEVMAEIDQSRMQAEAAVAGATGTFSTAGGSFTTGIRAQVDQGKVMEKISTQSRDFLAQIVSNTARMAGVSLA
jgi:chromosome segregation ATPase